MENLEKSVGFVEAKTFHYPHPIKLLCSEMLPQFHLIYETYGKLNKDRSNAVLICHALSGNHHVAGYYSKDDKYPGWWDTMVGPGKPIDTNYFFVVGVNNLGGCHGSTGPSSKNPDTGSYYGPKFPDITVKDWVKTQSMLADELGIAKWCAVVGGSLGGMQALQWAIDYPNRVENAVLIASAPRLSAQNIAFNEIARHAILSDVNYCDGCFLDKGVVPVEGLTLARMLAHITYQSDNVLKSKFDRSLKSGDLHLGPAVEFEVKSYLHYQGTKFAKIFDANTYLLMTRALDHFDPARDFDDNLVKALEQTQCKYLVIAFTSDWRFSPSCSKEIVDAMLLAQKDVVSIVIDAQQGHDAFLLPVDDYLEVMRTYMQRIRQEGER